MDVLKLASFAIGGVMLAMLLKQKKPEYSLMISFAVCLFLFLCILAKLQTVFGYFKLLEETVQLDSAYVGTLIKMLGITYIAQFASDVCKDAGFLAIASQIELFARISILFLSLPVLMALTELIGEVL